MFPFQYSACSHGDSRIHISHAREAITELPLFHALVDILMKKGVLVSSLSRQPFFMKNNSCFIDKFSE